MLKKILSWAGLILLIVAIPIATYLIRHQQIFKSRAATKPITFFGQGITEKDGQLYTDNLTVKVRLTSPITPPPSPTSPTSSPPLPLTERFAIAGNPVGIELNEFKNIYHYEWGDVYQLNPPPSQLHTAPNHTFAWMIGKLDQGDGSIQKIYDVEEPKIKTLLTNPINRGGVWIVGNEANVGPYVDPKIYAQQYIKYHDLIKNLDPTARFANSGLAQEAHDFKGVEAIPYLDTFLANLPDKSYWPDIYNEHFYPSGVGQNLYDKNLEQARAFKKHIDNIDPGKPLWITEFGMNAGNVDHSVAIGYMDFIIPHLINENLADRWFWFLNNNYAYAPHWDATGLSNDGGRTLSSTGKHYKELREGKTPPILADGNFDAGADLSVWTCHGDKSGTCTIDSATSASAPNSLKISNTGGGWGWQIGQKVQSFTTRYCLSAQIKKNNPADVAGVALQENGPPYREVDAFAFNKEGWQSIKRTIQVDPIAWGLPIKTFARVWNQGGTAWFDDISLNFGACQSENYLPASLPTPTPTPSPTPTPTPTPSPSPSPTPTAPLPVLNPGFESSKNNWWFWDPSSGSWVIDSSEKHSGNSSSKLQLGVGLCTSCGNTHNACINQGRFQDNNLAFWNPTLWASKTFNFSYWYKSTPTVSPALQIALRTGPNDSDLTTWWYPDGVLSNSPATTWTQASKNITIPATYNGKTVTGFDVSLCASTPQDSPTGEAAQAWFDDMSITPLGNALGVAYAANLYTTSYKLAENPTDLDQSTIQPYTSDPTEIDYTFKDLKPGIKTLFVQFIGQGGEKQQAQASIIYQPAPTPSPTTKPTPTTAKSEDNSGLATSCNAYISYQGNKDRYATWNKQCTGRVQASGSGGIGQNCCELACGADIECDEESMDQGNCNSVCQPTILREPSYLKNFLENLPAQGKAKYDVKDDKNNGLDTLKIIENPQGGYLGVYHNAGKDAFWVKLARSTDLLNWSFVTDLDSHASQPTIIRLTDGGFLVAYEKDNGSRSWNKFRYYLNLSKLLEGKYQYEYDAPRTLSPTNEGTPNIYSVSLSPDIKNSRIEVGFHFYKDLDGDGVPDSDRAAHGQLTNFNSWSASEEKELNTTLQKQGVKGSVGDRDNFSLDGREYIVQEAQLEQGVWEAWRTYLYNRKTGAVQLLELKTPHNTKGFANPTLTILTSPKGKKMAVATFFIFGATAPGEGGPAIFYKELPDANILPVVQPGGQEPTVQNLIQALSEPVSNIINNLPFIPHPSPIPQPSASANFSQADFNNDGQVNSIDLSILFNSWRKKTSELKYSKADINKDGIVNTLDYSVFLQNFKP